MKPDDVVRDDAKRDDVRRDDVKPDDVVRDDAKSEGMEAEDVETDDTKQAVAPTGSEREQTRDDTDAGWGELRDEEAQDQWLRDQRPPHWG